MQVNQLTPDNSVSMALLCDWIHIQKFKSHTKKFDITAKHSVSTVINKAKLPQYIILKMIEIFDLDHDIFWSGLGRKRDMCDVLNEVNTLLPKYRTQLLAPISHKPKWFRPIDFEPLASVEHFEYHSVLAGVLERFCRILLQQPFRGSHVWSWNNGLGQTMSAAAVSLIGESECTNPNVRTVGFSWKTLFSVLAHTMPVWVGGRGAADQWRSMGFDVFDDIINHDYQHADTVFQRCWQAVYLNRELLQDKHRLCQLKTHLHERFQRNVDLLYQDTVGQHWIKTYSEWCTRDQQQFLHAVLRVPEYDVRQGAKYLKHNFGITS
jgi:hypothetical protein